MGTAFLAMHNTICKVVSFCRGKHGGGGGGGCREPPPFLTIESRPADIFHPNWSCGQPTAQDIHVLFPLQQHVLERAVVMHCWSLILVYSEIGVLVYHDCMSGCGPSLICTNGV